MVPVVCGGSRVVPTLVLVSAAVLAGCGSLGSGAEVPTASDLSEVNVPPRSGLVAELIGADGQAASRALQIRLTSECMQQTGFEYIPDFSYDDFNIDRLDRDGVAVFGLGISIAFPEQEVVLNPKQDYLSSLDHEARDAYYNAYNTCRESATDAESDLLESAYASLSPSVQAELLELRGLTHPLLAEPIDQWSRCLADKGWQYDHPFLMIQSLMEEYAILAGAGGSDVESFQAEERKLALAAFSCRYEFIEPGVDQAILDLEARVKAELPIDSVYGE